MMGSRRYGRRAFGQIFGETSRACVIRERLPRSLHQMFTGELAVSFGFIDQGILVV
jgi:hypothetical protein